MKQSHKTTILLAENHALVRAGIRSLLEKIDGVRVVAEAEEGDQCVRLAAEHNPDIVFMDITMPRLNGLDATRKIKSEQPDTNVIILSMHQAEEYVLQALNAGADGYLLKDSELAELEIAIHAVLEGTSYLSPPISKHVITDYLSRDIAKRGKPQSHAPRLTPRQREVLQLIAEGHSTRKIALLLGISPKTVDAHRLNIMKRLDIHDLAGLIRYALRSGLAHLEDPPQPGQ